MKVFITGISGFAGNYLADYLLNLNKFEIFGTYQSRPPDSFSDKIKLYQLDLLDKEKTAQVVGDVKPDLVFHLAAMASPRKSFENPPETVINNIESQVNLLEAFKSKNLNNTRILIISSAEIYGLVSAEDLPIDEQTHQNPTNPYAVSKMAQDFLGLDYFLSFGLNIIRVRPFNHFGPRQQDTFVIPSLCRKIADYEKGKVSSVKVGNLESKRDFTDVRDMVAAYLLALEKGKPGEVYNLGSGRSYSIRNILQSLVKLSGLEIKIETDKELFMPSDNPNLVCDFSKFNKLTGWMPQIPLEKSLKDTLDYWRDIS